MRFLFGNGFFVTCFFAFLSNHKNYIAEFNAQYITGYAREHSYRPILQALPTALLPESKKLLETILSIHFC